VKMPVTAHSVIASAILCRWSASFRRSAGTCFRSGGAKAPTLISRDTVVVLLFIAIQDSFGVCA